MSQATELSLAPDGQLATALEPQEMPITALIQGVLKTGMTAESAGVVEKLAALLERMEDKKAEKAFNAAFVALQGDLPVIVASTVIQNRGKYEKFEDVMRVVQPLLNKHGFSVSFSMDFRDGRVLETCHLKHIGGHSQSNSFAVRTGKADTDTQADCKAATTAKRNALLNCLNIVIRQDAFTDEDNDASLEGAFIAADQVLYIKELLKDTGSDVPAFLKFAQADKVEEITTSKYDRLVAALHKKAGR